MEVTLKERIKYLKAQRPKVEQCIRDACRGATIRAVEKAAEQTPPTADSLRGTNTRSGEMKQHWDTDSKVNPTVAGNRYTTVLGNDKDYASYVNDGHRMDRHFVPGLVINEASGMLEYNPDGKGGIVVGTKTQYVKGLFMVDAAKEEYRRVLREELKEIGDIIG